MDSQVSVIIPIYKVEEYLNRCVDSVMNQSYKEIEIVLVDDGSMDRSGIICDQYAISDDRLIVVHKENMGLSSARNTGIECSHGEYLVFVDSDDWIRTDAIDMALMHIGESEADLLAFSFHIATKGKKENQYRVVHVDSNERLTIPGEEIIRDFHNSWKKVLIVAWNKIYKRTLFEKVRFVENVYHEDEFAIIDILKVAKSIYILDVPLYYYYLSDNSIIRTNNPEINKKKSADILMMYRNRIYEFEKLYCYEQAKYSFLDYVATLKKNYADLENMQLKEEIKEYTKLLREKNIMNQLPTFFKCKCVMFDLFLKVSYIKS